MRRFFRWLFGTRHKVFVGNRHVTTIRVRKGRIVRVNLQGVNVATGLIRFEPALHQTANQTLIVEYTYSPGAKR